MSKQQDIPASAIAVRTYAELEQFAKKFAEGKLNLLGIVGSAGLSKTQTLKGVLKSTEYFYLNGHSTGFAAYQDLYEHRDQPVLMDDADTLFADKKTAPLMKALCETIPVKTVSWRSGKLSRDADDDQIPRSFETRSRVCILANQWRTVTANLTAVADRGIFLHFCPSRKEVHRQVEKVGWLQDDEVLEYIGEHLNIMAEPSMRYYFKARQLKQAGFKDWMEKTLNMLNPDLDNKALEMVSKLLNDETYKNEGQRIKRFVESTGMSRATYFRYKGYLQDSDE